MAVYTIVAVHAVSRVLRMAVHTIVAVHAACLQWLPSSLLVCSDCCLCCLYEAEFSLVLALLILETQLQYRQLHISRPHVASFGVKKIVTFKLPISKLVVFSASKFFLWIHSINTFISISDVFGESVSGTALEVGIQSPPNFLYRYKFDVYCYVAWFNVFPNTIKHIASF